MEVEANYIGENKIFIPGMHGFSARYGLIDEKEAKKLKINDKVKIRYNSAVDIKVLEVLKEKAPA